MVVIAYVHTGRILKSNFWIASGVVMLILATICRSLLPLFPNSYNLLMGISMLF